MTRTDTGRPADRPSDPDDARNGRASRSRWTLRSALLGLFLLGMTGTTAELIFLEHYEEFWQWVPIALLGAGLIAGMVAAVRPRWWVLRALQVLGALFVAAGVLGVVLHYTGNVEFELEMAPAMRGRTLVWESLRGATPALAPAALAWLGLLGIACTWGHPGLRRH